MIAVLSFQILVAVGLQSQVVPSAPSSPSVPSVPSVPFLPSVPSFPSAPSVLSVVQTVPGEERNAMEPAARAYHDREYEKASDLFRRMLDRGEVPAALVLYNLGNCAYRLGDHAQAILCYRRVLARQPADQQAQFNLRLAEAQLGIHRSEPEGIGRTLEQLTTAPRVVALLWSIGTIQLAALAGAFLLRRRGRHRWLSRAFLALALTAFAVGLATTAIAWAGRPPEAVVLAEGLPLRSLPRADGEVLLELSAGHLVRLVGPVRDQDPWLRIEHGGASGWVEATGLAAVD